MPMMNCYLTSDIMICRELLSLVLVWTDTNMDNILWTITAPPGTFRDLYVNEVTFEPTNLHLTEVIDR